MSRGERPVPPDRRRGFMEYVLLVVLVLVVLMTAWTLWDDSIVDTVVRIADGSSR